MIFTSKKEIILYIIFGFIYFIGIGFVFSNFNDKTNISFVFVGITLTLISLTAIIITLFLSDKKKNGLLKENLKKEEYLKIITESEKNN